MILTKLEILIVNMNIKCNKPPQAPPKERDKPPQAPPKEGVLIT